MGKATYNQKKKVADLGCETLEQFPGVNVVHGTVKEEIPWPPRVFYTLIFLTSDFIFSGVLIL
jgi:hypothetical protein